MGFVNLDIPQTQPPNVMQAHHPHQQLSTQELIASVRARCNQTKEVKCIYIEAKTYDLKETTSFSGYYCFSMQMLMGSGWIGPT